MTPRLPLRSILLPVLLVAVLLGGCSDSGNSPPPPDCTSVADTSQAATVSYQNDIRPFFADEKYSCTSIGCHGETLPSSEYLLVTHADMFEAGPEARSRGICAVKPGDPDQSYIIWKIEGRSGTGERMPKGLAPMSAQDIATFRQWILEGARNN